MSEFFSIEIICALFGSTFQEILYWNSLKKKLSLKSVKILYKSVGYWLITFLTISSSTIGVMIWTSDAASTYKLIDFVLMGAAFPALFKLGVNSIGGNSAPKLGQDQSSMVISIRNYFFPEHDHG